MLDRRAWLQGLASMAVACPAWAQNAGQRTRGGSNIWPRQAVQVVVPFPAGGPSAILAKHLAKAFERQTQQSMRLNYQSGSAGSSAAAIVAKSAANGQTLLIGGSHLSAARALLPVDDFDFIVDLQPLALVAKVPQVVMVNPERMRSRTIMEWLSDLSRKPVRWRMATAGIGSSSHIYAALLKQHEELQFEYVHFRGSGPALQDLLIGSTDMMVDGLISSLPHIQSGRLKALMVSGDVRSSVLPDVPCAQEMGVDVFNRVTWYGMFAPKGLPEKVTNAVTQTCDRISQDTELVASFERLGIVWGGLYGEDFAQMVRQDTQDWAQLFKQAGMSDLLLKSSFEG